MVSTDARKSNISLTHCQYQFFFPPSYQKWLWNLHWIQPVLSLIRELLPLRRLPWQLVLPFLRSPLHLSKVPRPQCVWEVAVHQVWDKCRPPIIAINLLWTRNPCNWRCSPWFKMNNFLIYFTLSISRSIMLEQIATTMPEVIAAATNNERNGWLWERGDWLGMRNII